MVLIIVIFVIFVVGTQKNRLNEMIPLSTPLIIFFFMCQLFIILCSWVLLQCWADGLICYTHAKKKKAAVSFE